jgi:hypothetical protein
VKKSTMAKVPIIEAGSFGEKGMKVKIEITRK